MNIITIVGRSTKDVKTIETKSGKKVLNGSIAVNRAFDKDKADFFNITIWGKSAEVFEKYVKKGNLVGVTGSMEFDKYENKEGNMVQGSKLNVTSISLLPNPKKEGTSKDEEYYTEEKVEPTPSGSGLTGFTID